MVIKPSAVVAGVVVVTGLLLAGCGSGPNQAGSAAIVGNTVISLDAVQQEVTTAVATQSVAKQAQSQGQLDAISREVLTERIMHQVTAAAAAKYGITVSDADVDAYISKSGGIDKIASPVLSADDQRATARDQLIEAKYATGFVDSLGVTFDYFAADTEADAVAQAKQVAAKPSEFESMASSVASQGGDANVNQTYTLAQYLQNTSGVLAPMFGAQPNTVLVFSPNLGQSQEVWYVMKIDKRTGGMPLTVPSAAAKNANTAVLASVGTSLLRSVAQSLPIRISPRYGAWDPVSMQVVGSTDTASVLEFPVGNQK
ncbi:MAG TPA: SurA N-terminal domain-containing protein [Pseudonocardiaceae bacterium]|jgi:hypothetical protein|nr:SurA N-terminal domain-containing protein [Pseudonocardiaceae bacterium]